MSSNMELRFGVLSLTTTDPGQTEAEEEEAATAGNPSNSRMLGFCFNERCYGTVI
jgi:hypothetical protein